MWSSILGDDWNNTVKKADGRGGIFAKSPLCETSWQWAQVWNPWGTECPATSPNRENLAIPAVKRSTPTGKQPRGSPRTKWREYISDLAWPRFGLEAEELSEIDVDREVFRVLLGLLLLRISPKDKRAQNWVSQWVCNLHWNFLFM